MLLPPDGFLASGLARPNGAAGRALWGEVERSSRRDTQQYERMNAELQRNPQIKSLVERLETDYDARRGRRREQQPEAQEPQAAEETSGDSQTPLPPAVEQFLGELGNLGNPGNETT